MNGSRRTGECRATGAQAVRKNSLNSESFMERVIGFEPTTLCLASTRSTN
jgi:hypothetical protein